MNYTTRPYQSQKDLYEIGRLIRRSYGKRKYFDAWCEQALFRRRVYRTGLLA